MRQIYYIPPTHKPYPAIRLTVETVTLKELGVIARQQREITNAFAERAAAEKEAGHELTRAEQDQWASDAGWQSQACRLIASTIKVEILGTQDKFDPQTEDPAAWPWKAATLADLGWDTPEGFMSVPSDLAFEWAEKAHEVNPGIWGNRPPSYPGQKKATTGVLQVP